MTDFNQRSQKVDTQYNAGKDQIIQNIVLVGQFLDFAKVEGLIPKPTPHANFDTLINAFEQTFSARLGSDLAYATATTGEILKEIIAKWTPQDKFAALPLKSIIDSFPGDLYQALSKRNYWNAFYENIHYYWAKYDSGDCQSIRLYSLEILWEKHFGTKFEFRIVKGYRDENASLGIGETRKASWEPSFIFSGARTYTTYERFDTYTMTYEQFRVLIAGMVIDLIRLSSIASTDVNFWKSIASLLEIKK
jgi:hypothetical protein